MGKKRRRNRNSPQKKKGRGGRPRGDQKVRVDLRRNTQTRTREQNLTQQLLEDDVAAADTDKEERLSGKGRLSRRRTIITGRGDGDQRLRDVSHKDYLEGRVVSAIGLNSMVQTGDGKTYECSVRQVLRKMTREGRNAVVTGDRVLFRPEGDEHQGVIERVEPRYGVLSRSSYNKEHVLVSNVDQVLIVASADDPPLKPNLIDRYLVSAEYRGIRPIVCINKIDLADVIAINRVARVYGRIGYDVVLTSVMTGQGIQRLRALLTNRETALSGQSGVGKSSLLNEVAPDLNLETSEVSDRISKGRHTTRRARLMPLPFGGWVADTPGIRQFSLWNIAKEEIEAFFIEFPPFVARCRFPDCTHTHETGCGVKQAVEENLIHPQRYESYCRMLADDEM